MKKIITLITFLISLGIIVYFWLIQSGSLMQAGSSGIYVSLGRLAGLLAVNFVLWQLVLVGRINFLNSTYGFDRLAIIHHFNGLLAWVFIFLHPIFLVLGYSAVNQNSIFNQILEFIFKGENLFPSFIAVLIFLVTIILSITVIFKKTKYETWYFVHLFTYLAIILAFGHQLESGYDLQNKVFAAYWFILYFLTVGPLIIFRFLKPLYNFYQHRFYVEKIILENENVLSIYIKGNNLDKFKFISGQFAIFRFLSGWLSLEAHPFSFSQAANGNNLRISIKNLGDFSVSLFTKLKVGCPVIIDGPHGIFKAKRAKNKKLALIAGGIGITPLRAIVESNPGLDLVLFYGERNERSLVFKNELDNLISPYLKINYIVSADSNWTGELGRIDSEKIKRLMPDYLERDFFLCGPKPMVKSLKKDLKVLGVKNRKIYFEKFSLN